MNLRRIVSHTLVLLFSLLSLACIAGDFSYVYIQGDKKTPIYVKFEDQMIPRYGKNYSIISQLAPGPINIEILFQQNIYPPQKFVINVPENGFRGFLLMQDGETFSLYDLHNKYYIQAGNTAAEDVLNTQTAEPIATAVPTEEPVKTVEKPKQKPVTAKVNPPKKKTTKPVAKIAAPIKNTEPAGPVFIDDIELNNDRTVKEQGTVSKDGTTDETPALVNSDCPKPVSDKKFDGIYKTTTSKMGTERLKYLMDELDNCYTTRQVSTLVRALKTDAERFTYLKNIYSRVTDQSVFKRLENTLTTEEWKGYFRELLQ